MPATGQAVGTQAGTKTGATTMDRENSLKIRQSLTKDNSLSSGARNVQVTSRNGKVTLRGTVSSEQEKQTIEQRAQDVAGSGNVTDHLTVRRAKK